MLLLFLNVFVWKWIVEMNLHQLETVNLMFPGTTAPDEGKSLRKQGSNEEEIWGKLSHKASSSVVILQLITTSFVDIFNNTFIEFENTNTFYLAALLCLVSKGSEHKKFP